MFEANLRQCVRDIGKPAASCGNLSNRFESFLQPCFRVSKGWKAPCYPAATFQGFGKAQTHGFL